MRFDVLGRMLGRGGLVGSSRGSAARHDLEADGGRDSLPARKRPTASESALALAGASCVEFGMSTRQRLTTSGVLKVAHLRRRETGHARGRLAVAAAVNVLQFTATARFGSPGDRRRDAALVVETLRGRWRCAHVPAASITIPRHGVPTVHVSRPLEGGENQVIDRRRRCAHAENGRATSSPRSSHADSHPGAHRATKPVLAHRQDAVRSFESVTPNHGSWRIGE